MKIKFFTQAADLLGLSETYLETKTSMSISDIMQQLSVDLGQQFQQIFDIGNSTLSNEFFILLNGVHIARLQGTDTIVHEGDVMAIVPVMEAG